MASKVMHGARAKLMISDPSTGKVDTVGIFSNVSFGVQYDVAPVFLLGRFSADELVYTGQEVVNINATGFRVIGSGPHKVAGVPELAELLSRGYLQMVVWDRGSNQPIAKFHSVKAVGYSTTLSSRQLEEMSVSFVGLLVDDETGTNEELPDAATLP